MTDQRNGGIAWCDETWNPFRGCSRVSAGCECCYAEVQASRYLRKDGGPSPYQGLVSVRSKTSGLRYEVAGAAGEWTAPRWTGKVAFVPSKLREPLSWTRHRRIFTNSMSDMFHESIPREQIAAVLGVMMLASNQTFITLTKRPERMREMLNSITEDEAAYALTSPALALHIPEMGAARGRRVAAAMRELGRDNACPNPSGLAGNHPWMQWGVSVEDQKSANERILHLLQTNVRVRIVSYEPALGPVDFRMLNREGAQCYDALTGHAYYRDGRHGLGGGPSLDQIIVGGESQWPNGPRARPFDVRWAYDVIEQCNGTPCVPFVKQMGSAPYDSCESDRTTDEPHPDGPGADMSCRLNLNATKGDDMEEWPEALRVQLFPPEPRA